MTGNWFHLLLVVLVLAVAGTVGGLHVRGERTHRRIARRLDAIESEIAEHRAHVEH